MFAKDGVLHRKRVVGSFLERLYSKLCCIGTCWTSKTDTSLLKFTFLTMIIFIKTNGGLEARSLAPVGLGGLGN